MQSKGTVVSVQRVQELKPHQWGYEITSIEEKKVAMRVSSASDSIVGRYQLFVDTTHRNPQGEIDKYRYKNPDDVYILFNPWCRGKRSRKLTFFFSLLFPPSPFNRLSFDESF